MTDGSFAVQESLRSPSAGKSVNGMLDVTERVTVVVTVLGGV